MPLFFSMLSLARAGWSRFLAHSRGLEIAPGVPVWRQQAIRLVVLLPASGAYPAANKPFSVRRYSAACCCYCQYAATGPRRRQRSQAKKTTLRFLVPYRNKNPSIKPGSRSNKYRYYALGFVSSVALLFSFFRTCSLEKPFACNCLA